MVPVKVFQDYVICFEALPEPHSMHQHFIQNWGWSTKDFNKIKAKNYAWFCASVVIYKDAKPLARTFLGCCSYQTEEEFYTTYAGDYFADMVWECAKKIKDEAFATWAQGLRK